MTPDDVTVAQLFLWAGGIAAFLASVSAISAFLSRGTKKNAEKIATLDDQLDSRLAEAGARADRQENRIARIEQTIAGLPAKEDIHAVQISLAEIRGDIRAVQATIDGTGKVMTRLEQIVTRHEDHLLSGNRK